MPTIEEVCKFRGAGYGQCWSCPVLDCPLRQSATDGIGAVARAAVARLTANELQIETIGGLKAVGRLALMNAIGTGALLLSDNHAELAADQLVEMLFHDEPIDRLRAYMAAEAIDQGLLDSEIGKRIDALWVSHVAWMRQIKRVTTPDEEADFQSRLDAVRADVGQEVYQVIDREQVRRAVAAIVPLRKRPTQAWRDRNGIVA